MRRSLVLFPALVFMLGLAVYANSLRNGFTFDDQAIVVENPVVRSLDVGRIFSSRWWYDKPEVGLYRPLTVLTYALNYAAHGLSPYGYHLVNVVLHLLNGSLVFWIGLAVLGNGAAAGVAALAFVLHPVQTEAVNGVVGRADLLSAFWVLLAWALYIGASRASGRRLQALYGASLLAGLLGCFAKEEAVVLVGLLAAYDALVLLRREEAVSFGRVVRRDLPRYVPFVLVVLLYLVVRHAAIGSILLPALPLPVDNLLAHLPASQRMATAVAVLGKYAGLLVFPRTLSADYSYDQVAAVGSVLDVRFLVGLLLLAGMCVVIVQGVRRQWAPEWGFGLAIWGLAILPVSNLLFPIGTVMGERLLYLPSVGFCFLLGAGYLVLSRAGRPAWLAPAAAALLLGAYGVRTVVRNPDWRDNFTLFSSAVEAAPRSAKAHFNLGNALRDRGKPEEALQQYRKALAIYPGYAEVQYNAGVLYQKRGKTQQALDAYRQALLADSTHVGAWINLGTLLGRSGEYERATQAFERAMALEPGNPDIQFNYGLACQQLGRDTAAQQAYLAVLKAEPGNVDAAINLGSLYAETGYTGEAVAVYRRLLRVRPKAFRVAYNLGATLARLGQNEAAAEAFLQASGGPGDRGAFASYEAGILYFKSGKREASRQALEAFLKRWTGDAKYRLNAEWVLKGLRKQ